MNILITGCTGFIGKSCYEYFKNIYNIFAPTHQELDLLNLSQLQKFIDKNHINAIINTANIIARKYAPLTKDKIYDCLLMFENILYASKNCEYFIHFGSGAELGHYLVNDISLAKEEILCNVVTTEYGGFAKNLMSKRLLSLHDTRQCYNLRVAGCFGKFELENRFIKSNIYRAINNQPLLIHQNRFMDFIYVNDLIKVIEYIFHNTLSFKDINCVYTEKYTLLDIAKIIQNITRTNTIIQIENPDIGASYTLDNTRLRSLNIDFIGLNNGIEQMYRDIK